MTLFSILSNEGLVALSADIGIFNYEIRIGRNTIGGFAICNNKGRFKPQWINQVVAVCRIDDIISFVSNGLEAI